MSDSEIRCRQRNSESAFSEFRSIGCRAWAARIEGEMSGYGASMGASKIFDLHYGHVSMNVDHHCVIHQDYSSLAKLVAEWEAAALMRWEANHG